ncbi:MAG: DUF6174 domain-containing protein [Balneolales bacterium]|nr:DUF6174 domain-containing protein [Balneolales bacterium]
MLRLTSFLLFLFFACPPPSLLEEYAEKRIIWSQLEIQDYSYNYLASCFGCMVGEVVVVVENNRIRSVLDPDTMEDNLIEYEGEMVPVYSVMPDEFYTIDEFFLVVKDGIRNSYTIEIAYNTEFAFPEEVHIDFFKKVEDEEISYLLHSFSEN